MGQESSALTTRVSHSLRSLRSLGGSKKQQEECDTNYALVFIKPHAANDAVKEFVQKHLESNKIEITGESTRSSEELATLVDKHYQLIHKHAMVEDPKALKLSEEKKKAFKEEFGVDWDAAVADGRILNLGAFQEMNGDVDVGKEWDAKGTAKMGLGPGAAVGKLLRQGEEGEYHFVINGFYADMRNEFTKDESKVICFTVKFKEDDHSFHDFRQNVVGSTNPEKAKEGSLRWKILQEWEQLGIPEKPDYGKNGVHASAGPIEGLYERNLWFGTEIEKDPFGRAMLDANVSKRTIDWFIGNNEIVTSQGNKPAFVITEGMNSSDVINEALTLQSSSAFEEILSS